MRNALIPVLVLASLSSSGCADLFVISRSIPKNQIEGRLGQEPTLERRQAITAKALEQIAIDPDSVKIRAVDRVAVPGWSNGGLWGWLQGGEGWLWSAQINGRNRFGGYAGWTRYTFLYNSKADRYWCGKAGGAQMYPFDVGE